MKTVTFHGEELVVLEGVYDPEDDSRLLLDAAVEEVRREDRVLDLCTGSGIVARVLSGYVPGGWTVGSDIDWKAVSNARLNGVQAVCGDIFAPFSFKFDLITCNPPYLPIDRDERLKGSTAWNGGQEGTVVIERVVRGVRDYLSDRGRLLLVISSLNRLKDVRNLMGGEGLTAEIVGESSFFFEKLYVLKGTLKE